MSEGGELNKLQDVLDALRDRDCRNIIINLESPMTAEEISERCDLPLSTTYRKLDLLTNALLLEELMELKKDGHHVKQYRVDFEEIDIILDQKQSLRLNIKKKRSPDQKLQDLWTEIRKEV